MSITGYNEFCNIINKRFGSSVHFFLLKTSDNVCLMYNHKQRTQVSNLVRKLTDKVMVDTGSDDLSIQDIVRIEL